MTKKTLLSGVKPSGRPHIGNFFGAMKQFADLQESHHCMIFIPDYHALTTTQNRDEMRQNILDVAIDYLAIGLDPKKVLIYKQSDIPEHTELAWIFETITTMPYLMRAHAFKDAEARSKEINAGVFNYPLLMAADILLYDADLVPVGHDQKQHIEIARDTAEKFNHIFGETFKLPEGLILDNVKTVPGIDGQKMSKSYGNTIPLFASDEEIKKAVMSIVTDSASPAEASAKEGGGVPKNVYAIHELVRDKTSLEALYEEKKGKYKDLKEALIEDLIAFIKPMREKRESIASDIESVKNILREGGAKARAKAQSKMEIVREKIGVKL
ncbi:MAG: tryptophan--tRNA ligase [bacterium]|nr:tryptophan--tRNA ligase [bacterium]